MADLRGGPVRPYALRIGARAPAVPVLTPNEATEAERFAAQRDAGSEFIGGLRAGTRGLRDSAEAYIGQAARTLGMETVGDQMLADAAASQEYTANTAPRVGRLRDIQSISDFGDYAANMAGQGVATIAPVVATAAATRGAGLNAAKALPINAAPMAVPMAGESLQAINADPEAAKLSDAQKLALSTALGTGGAALEAVVPTLAVGRVAAPLTKPLAGNVATRAAKTLAKDAAGEGASEVSSNELNRQALNVINPARDTSGDMESRADEFAAAALGAGPVLAPTAVLASTADSGRAAVDKTTQTAGRISDALRDRVAPVEAPPADIRPLAEQLGAATGNALDAAIETTGKAKDWLKNRMDSGPSDFDTLFTEQQAPEDIQDFEAAMDWMNADDGKRNAAATRIATAYLNDPEAPADLRAASKNYMDSDKTGVAWQTYTDVLRSHKADEVVSDGVSTLVSALEKAGLAIGKAGSDFNKGYDESRKNAQSPDPFDDLLARTMMSHVNTSDTTENLIKIAGAVPPIKAWIKNGFKDKAGAVIAPEGLSAVFDDPVAALTDIATLMRKQGLIDDKTVAAIDDLKPQLEAQVESKKHLGAIVEDNLLPVAQDAHQFSGAEHVKIGERIRDWIQNDAGTKNKEFDKTLDQLFGANKETVLEAVAKAIKFKKGQNQGQDKAVQDSDGRAHEDAEDASYEELEGITNAINPNEAGEDKVDYHGEFAHNSSEGGANKARDMQHELEAKGHTVSKIGLTDALRERYQDDPVMFGKELADAIDRKRPQIEAFVKQSETPVRAEEALNQLFYTLRSEIRGERESADTIKGREFAGISKKNHPLAISVGKDREYGGREKGVLYFERANRSGVVDKATGEIKPTEFAVSAAKLLARVKGVESTDGVTSASARLNKLTTAIAAMLTAKNDDGSSALTGRVGVLSKTSKDIEWLNGKDLPDDFVLNGLTIKEIKEGVGANIREEHTEALRKWVDANDNGSWTSEDERGYLATIDKAAEAEANLKKFERELEARRKAGMHDSKTERVELARLTRALRSYNRNVKTLSIEKETADFVDKANAALYRKDADTIKNILDAVTDDRGSLERQTKEATGTAEVDEMASEANKAENEKARIFDDTGTPVQPYNTRAEKEAARAKLDALYPEKQVTYLLDLLRKGVPAANAAFAKMTDTQKAAARSMLSAMVEAKSPDAPIWHGNPPKDHTAFANRARQVMAKLPETRKNMQSAFGNFRADNSQPVLSQVKEEIRRRLGPKIKVEFGKLFDANGVELSGESIDNIIKISIDSANPSQIGAHESLHEFFRRLTKDGSLASRKIQNILLNAASSKAVINQLERLLADHPNALAQIKAGAEHFQEERLAYMFQFWQAGLLNIGPETKSVFGKIKDFLRRMVGMLSTEQKAEALLDAFDAGETQTPDAAAEVLAKMENREQRVRALLSRSNPLLDRLGKTLAPIGDRLERSNNPHLVELIHKFKAPTAEAGHAQSFFEADVQKKAEYMNRINNYLHDVSDKDLELTLRYLREGDLTKKRPAIHVPRIAALYDNIRKTFDEIAEYMHKAGVKRMNEDGEWEDFRDVKEYFTRVYNTEALTKNPQEFIDGLMAFHKDELDKIAASISEKQGKRIEPHEVARGILDRLVGSYGVSSISESMGGVSTDAESGKKGLKENEGDIGYSPFMRAVNERSLSWIDTNKFEHFMNNDLVGIMTTYIAQATKRAEYTRRFGLNGENIAASLAKAHDYEVAKEVAARYETDIPLDMVLNRPAILKAIKKNNPAADVGPDDINAIYTDVLERMQSYGKGIMAMEGTLGYDIDPTLRRINGTAMVYENMRTMALSLFSQLIDPLGIVVRGGEMKDAMAAYRRGLKEVWASWKGEHTDDAEAQLAEMLGTVDASGFLANFGQMHHSMYLNGKIRRMNERLFRFNGMEGFNRATRITATQAAISFLKRHKALPNGERSAEYLAELNLKPEDITMDADGNLNYDDPKIREAIYRWVNGAILRPNAAQRPSWASDPRFMLIWHMKQFSYTFHDVILKRVWKEAKNNDNLTPLGTMLATFIPTMIAADAAKAILLTGNEPGWMRAGLPSMLNHGVNRAGLFGMAQPEMDVIIGTHDAASLGGPAVEQAVDALTQPFAETLQDALPGSSVLNTIEGPAVPKAA